MNTKLSLCGFSVAITVCLQCCPFPEPTVSRYHISVFVVSAFVFGRFELTVFKLFFLSGTWFKFLHAVLLDQRVVASGNASACMCLCFLLMSMAPSFAQLLQVKSNL